MLWQLALAVTTYISMKCFPDPRDKSKLVPRIQVLAQQQVTTRPVTVPPSQGADPGCQPRCPRLLGRMGLHSETG